MNSRFLFVDVTPTGSLRRRSRASPGDDEDGLLEFLRHSSPAANDLRERSAWGSLGKILNQYCESVI